MANTQAYGLTQPRTDTYFAASGQTEAYTVIPATSTSTPTPDGNTAYVNTQNADTVRAFVAYSGTVTSATLRLWLLQDGAWYRASDTTLTPQDGNEAYDYQLIGHHTDFTLQLTSVAGGGTVAVSVVGVY